MPWPSEPKMKSAFSGISSCDSGVLARGSSAYFGSGDSALLYKGSVS